MHLQSASVLAIAVCRYRVYHHYRAQGWVVRSGYQLGSDWALYKQGPQHFHATYTLAVQVVLWGNMSL